MTRSDYGEEGDAKRTPPQVAKTIEEARKNRPWIPKTTTLDAEGRLRDKVDHPFVADADVVGTWKVVDFVREKDQFVAGKQRWQGELDFLKGTRFDQDGTVAVKVEDRDWRKHGGKWTKGMVLHDDTASEYEITRAGGKTYLFYQWKSGDYTIRYSKPAYYVLQEE
jgi:bla regulator protein BlaR1